MVLLRTYPIFQRNSNVGLGTVSHIQGTPVTVSYSEYGTTDPFPDAVITLSGPDNQTIEDNQNATFTVVATVTGAPESELLYQWEQETAPGSGTFEPIAGAIAATFTTGRLSSLTDNGRNYRVVVSAGGSNPETSQNAAVTIIPDTTAPSLVSAKGDASFRTILLTYDELVLRDVASDQFNYLVSDGVNDLVVFAGQGLGFRSGRYPFRAAEY